MSHPILERLKKTIKARGFTLRAVSEQLEPPMSPAMLSRALLGQHRLHPRYYDQILDIVGEPRALFWRRYYESIAEIPHPGLGDLDPAHLLRLVAGRPATELPEPVAQLISTGLPSLEADPFEALPPALRELDDLRLIDPGRAHDECLAWIERCRLQLFIGNLDVRNLAELLAALGAFASVLRTRGQSRLAAAILASALDATSRSPVGLVMAWLLWRSAPILTDAGYPRLALAHLRQAAHIFLTFGQGLDAVGVNVSTGVHYAYLADFNGARRCFEMCLADSSADDGYKLLALSNLAKMYEDTNRPDRAIALVDQLETLAGRMSGRLHATARWIKARAVANSGDLERGAEELASLQGDVARFCTAIDPVLLFFDYASVLIRMGDSERLRIAAGIASEQLSELHLDSKLLRLASRALERMAENSIQASDLRRIRRKLANL